VAVLATGVWATYQALRPGPIEVSVQAAERAEVEATVANTRAGTVTACRRARLAPQTGGRVARLPVRPGQSVKQGEVLLELWNDDLRTALSRAEQEVVASEARAEQACLNAGLALRDAERAEALAREQVVGEQQRDRAVAASDASRAECAAVRAAVAETRGRVRAVRDELAKTVLLAPFDGIVAELTPELGEVVTPSPPGIPTPPAVDLIEPGCLYVVAPIDEVDAPRVRVDQAARVTLDAFPGRSFEGRVRRIAPYVLDREKQARTVDVEVDLLDPAAVPELIAGYSADVEILLDRRDDVVRVPSEALMEGGRLLLLEGGTIVERKVEIGLANWQFTEVVSGLAAGEQVIVSLDREGVAPGAAAVAAPPSE
jgi:HlyD family secretion protein